MNYYLNCHSVFSFNYGTITVESLLQHAQMMGVQKLALTDINNTSGCLEFIRQAKKYNIDPAVGVDFRNGDRQMYVAIAKNNEGFQEINEFLSYHLMHKEDFPETAPNFMHVWVIYPFAQQVYPRTLAAHEYIGVSLHDLNRLKFYQGHPPEKLCLQHAVSFLYESDFKTHKLLRAVHHNIVLTRLTPQNLGRPRDLFLPKEGIRYLQTYYPFLLKNAHHLLEHTEIVFEFGGNKNKKSFFGSPVADFTELRRLAYEGMITRFGKADPVVMERMEKELTVINQKGFNAYFLINWDIVNYAKHKQYFHVGRGSGANSLVAYCLGITNVNPIELDLYFERFINPSRQNPPDFDVDFSWKDRDDVVRYIYERHGKDHVALLATYSTYKIKAVVRELGKVFGLPKEEIDGLLDHRKNLQTPDKISKAIKHYSYKIHGIPRHLSIHAGGLLISNNPITCYTALELPPKGFQITQFSMLEAEDIGLHKLDILSQRGLGHIKDAVELVKQNQGIDIDIHRVEDFKKDPNIIERLEHGKTIGCFYIESPAMRQLLKKMRARTYLELVAASSIIRPGVAKSGMMREYILRFHDEERRKNANPVLQQIMPETFGIMVYQEDVIKVAHFFAELTLEEADILRRGMSGKYRGREEFQRVKEQFFNNCKRLEHDDELTQEVWHQIESFAGFAFAKGHSASYAVESYQSLYLKTYYPLEFMVGVINNFGGFYSREVYFHEARRSGAKIEAPCINRSNFETTIDGKTIFIGFQHIKDLDSRTSEELLKKRGTGYYSLEDVVKRCSISLEQVKILIRIDAFRCLGKQKKELMWEAYMLLGEDKVSKPVPELFDIPATQYTLPALTQDWIEDAYDQLEVLNFTLQLPFHLVSEPKRGYIGAADLLQYVGKAVTTVGYLVHVKNTRTASNKHMHFGTFIDQQGGFLDTVHFPGVADRYPMTSRGCYEIEGVVTEEFGCASIEVRKVRKLSYHTVPE